MFTRSTPKTFLPAAAGALMLIFTLGSLDASADPPRGYAPRADWSSHSVRKRTESGHTTQTQWTSSDGKTATRNAVVTNDKDNAARTRDVTYTGANGKTSTVNSVTTRTDSGYSRTVDAIGPNGQGQTRVKTITCDRSIGSCTIDAVNNGTKH